jgi:hypothetical protein
MGKGGIYISGLSICGGRLQARTFLLEDELAREFASSIPGLSVKVTKKFRTPVFIVRHTCYIMH